MKELSIEEKAKRYNEALERARNLHKDAIDMEDSLRAKQCEIIFPELKESKDERIRKALINVFSTHKDYEMFFGVSVEDIRAWLEKQGEQKPADKVEPKFKNGQWIVWQNKCYKVNYNGCGYELIDQNGLSTSLEYVTVDENANLWTIQDAKDGDVLAAHECLVLFKEIDGLNIRCYCTYHYMGFNPSFHINTLQNKTAFQPATKEQRDTLEKAITNAGYRWDKEKLKLEKV